MRACKHYHVMQVAFLLHSKDRLLNTEGKQSGILDSDTVTPGTTYVA
jgi:hypothetical protein